MAIDTSIQFNGYNSYKFNQGDKLACYPFGVEGMENITHSFGAYSPVSLVDKVRANTKFFDADSEIIQTVSHSFNISLGTFDKRDITVTVPLGAIKAQLTFTNSEVSPWWVATPKTEEGQNATPYTINAYGQLTYITPNGIYTGTLTANQIVLASGNESLSDRLVTINSNQISLQNNISVTDSKVTTIQAGQISLSNKVDGQGEKITNIESGQISLSNQVGAQSNQITDIEAGQITLTSKVDGLDTKTTKITSTGVYTGEIVANQVDFEGGRIGGFNVTGDNLVGNAVSLKPNEISIGASRIFDNFLNVTSTQSLSLDASRIQLGNNKNSWLLFDDKIVMRNTGFSMTSIFDQVSPVNGGLARLGTSDARWENIYLSNQPDIASDTRLKNNIHEIPKALIYYLKEIKPKMYLQKDKWHFGYIAQDVERALYKYSLSEVGFKDAWKYVKKFAFLCKDESYMSLLYGEIAVLKEAEMQDKIDGLEGRLKKLEMIVNEK